MKKFWETQDESTTRACALIVCGVTPHALATALINRDVNGFMKTTGAKREDVQFLIERWGVDRGSELTARFGLLLVA